MELSSFLYPDGRGLSRSSCNMVVAALVCCFYVESRTLDPKPETLNPKPKTGEAMRKCIAQASKCSQSSVCLFHSLSLSLSLSPSLALSPSFPTPKLKSQVMTSKLFGRALKQYLIHVFKSQGKP